jgi:prepilin peptidase CpaA
MNQESLFITSLPWGVVIVASLAAALTDISTGKIPNRLTGPLFLTGLAWGGCIWGWSGFLHAAGAAVILSLPFIILFVFAQGGAGDAKMMGAIGAWLGMTHPWHVLVAVAAVGVILSLAYASRQGRLGQVLNNCLLAAMNLALVVRGRYKIKKENGLFPAGTSDLTVPYGLAIFFGVTLAAIWVHFVS